MQRAKVADKFHSWKPTQGHEKMLRYIDELVRNKNFRADIKRLKRLEKKSVQSIPDGLYDSWTSEQKKKHDEFNNKFGSIIDGYELLRKRCKKFLRNKSFIQKEKIAFNYALDLDLLMFAVAIMDETEAHPEMAISATDPVDMCCLIDMYDEQLVPFNKCDEIIYLNPKRQLRLAAYPIAICINQRASKRDILDYIEKRWEWIDGMRRDYQEKALKIRERKYDQEMIDFIWENRTIPPKKIKEKLDEKFPKNGLVYYEISKIIYLEKERRYKEI